ncbi:related to mRNA guanylyltransferase [Cephalotrichum gorgonifer]|uniref:mRNA-capping enzyme subunit alpha n=1 Tax=Cephalotrichum gorgonifer TaxID=2041049 RepID=A0AAE8MY07_9PEZI|nr:related to mRNA guanylyltransferase [Cephalotrichum gorgonifer]
MSQERPIESIGEPGIRATGEVLQIMRAEVAGLLNRSQRSFPGAQPVSFARSHIKELQREDYFVCEKSDGIRYLLYLTEDELGQEAHYLIDRKNDYWFINNKSLHLPTPQDVQSFHTQTLVDGELVMDIEGTRRVPRFLLFDCLVIDGKNIMERPLDKRLAYMKEHIYAPYKKLFQEFPEELQYQPFEVRMKDMQLSYGMEMMFKDVLPHLKHGNDGLIFTCRTSSYRHGTDPHILKWKPPEENTIDCRLKIYFPLVEPDDEDIANGITQPYYDYHTLERAELWVYMGDNQTRYKKYADAYITDKEFEQLMALGDPLNDRIVESYRDDMGRWRISRFRDDKLEANHISTLNSVMESIEDGVTEQELVNSAKLIKDSWKARNQRRP